MSPIRHPTKTRPGAEPLIIKFYTTIIWNSKIFIDMYVYLYRVV